MIAKRKIPLNKVLMYKRYLIVALVLSITPSLFGQEPVSQERPPIIDMHLHAYSVVPGRDMDFFWLPEGISPPTSTEQLMRATLAEMRRYNIVKGWASGPIEVVASWKAAAPEMILGAPDFTRETSFPSVRQLRAEYESGRLEGLGELVAQLAGLTPSDPFFEPYLALAEQLDIPVAFHTGFPPPGSAYGAFPRARASLGSPFGVEDALLRHPNLRAYIMHAGYPFLEDTIAFLHAHPQVYVDLAEINWMIPRAEFHEYLRRLMQSGFGGRLIFGSDQMFWPAAIGLAIEGIESATFLTQEQKRDIFYNNAARFLRLEEE
jgi:predicted TIM-barrel fold metal-dependent hydrolase